MAASLKDRFHIAKTAQELSTLQSEVDSFDSSYPAFYHLMKSHWLRENNKRAKILNFSQAILSPYDGGLRPLTIPPIADSNIFAINGDNLITIDGSDLVLI